MNFIKLYLTVAIASFGMSAMGAEIKLGYIDMQKAVQATKAGKKAKGDLEKEVEKRRKEFADKEKDLQKQGQELEKKALVLSDDVRQKRQGEFQQEIMKFREAQMKTQMELQNKERDLMSPILEKMKKAIEKVAKEQSLSFVLERAEHSVTWADPSLDVTNKVIETFEKL